jgi:competence ComEA-like helix-hairpin-helix protein
MKKSYKTSEFWFTLVSFLISGLFLFGVITEPDTKDDLIQTVTHAVESVILVGGQYAVLSRYLKKRKEEKIEHEKTKQKEQENLKKEIEDYVGVDKKHDTININKAGIGELIQLPHIGPSIAQKLIEYRIDNGHFKDKLELLRVNGIGTQVLKDIEKYIVL